jgi:hypothetical protein
MMTLTKEAAKMSNQFQNDNSDIRPREEKDMSYLIVDDKNEKGKRLIAIIELEPYDKLDARLGVYDESSPPKGFMVEFTPEVIHPESLKSHIRTTRKSGSMYELKLFLENDSSIAVSAEVWELE